MCKIANPSMSPGACMQHRLFVSFNILLDNCVGWFPRCNIIVRCALVPRCVSEAGVLVKSYVDRGILVPDDIMTRLMLPKLEQLSTHSWLLDGESNYSFFFSRLSCWSAFWSFSQPFQLPCWELWWSLAATPPVWLVSPGPAPRSAEASRD